VLVVFLIEGAAGDEDSDGHGDVARSASKVESREQGARSREQGGGKHGAESREHGGRAPLGEVKPM